VTYQRSFIRDQDIEPDERFVFSFALKNLGEYNYSADAAALGGGGESEFLQ
jgi:LPS-assembly protein